MFILVDQNEKATNPKVVENLLKVFPNLTVANLAFGDINVILDDGTIIAIERKRASDFLGSIADGRVFRQVEQMANGSKFSCIIVEGSFTFNKNDMAEVDGEETNWKGASVRGAMMAIQFSGCPIVVSTPKLFPETVLEVIKFCQKPVEHHQSLSRKRVVTFPPLEIKEEVISSFPGIGLMSTRSLFDWTGKQNDKGAATLAEALCWITSFHKIALTSRPEGWSDRKIDNFRIALGLKPNQYLDLKEENNGDKKASKKSK